MTEQARKLFDEFNKIPLYILTKYRNYPVVKNNYDDLLQEGYMGLIKACNYCDPLCDEHKQYVYIYTAVNQQILRAVKKIQKNSNQISIYTPIVVDGDDPSDLTLGDTFASDDVIDKESITSMLNNAMKVYKKYKYNKRKNVKDDHFEKLQLILEKIAIGYSEAEIADSLNLSRQRVHEMVRNFGRVLKQHHYNI